MRHSREPPSCHYKSGPGRPNSTAGVPTPTTNEMRHQRQQQQAQQVQPGGTTAINSHLYPSTSSICAPNRPTTSSFSDIRQASLKSTPTVSPSAMSSLNISTPLDRLSECDAITKRLMSSPIRTVNLSEKPVKRTTQISELDKSRRASLGTKSITDQVSAFASNQFNSLELSHGWAPDTVGSRRTTDERVDQRRKGSDSFAQKQQRSSSSINSGNDSRLKQQQVRSLSVCQEETLKPRFRNNNTNHSSNLNRAVSLACESGSSSSKRLLTIIPLFGCDMKALEQYMRSGLILPPPINSAIDHILTHGIEAIGIFRKSGVKSRILTLKQRIERNQAAKVDEINVENEFSIYDIADLVKMWFRELQPSPIMTRDLIKKITVFLQTHSAMLEEATVATTTITALTNTNQQTDQSSQAERRDEDASSSSTSPSMQDEVRCRLMKQISSTISPSHRILISRAMSFFATISSKSDVNQMTSQNLAICLTPSLCATETDQASILLAQRALKYCIDNPHLWAENSGTTTTTSTTTTTKTTTIE